VMMRVAAPPSVSTKWTSRPRFSAANRGAARRASARMQRMLMGSCGGWFYHGKYTVPQQAPPTGTPMKRLLLLVLLLVCPVLAQKPPKADAILELELPESAPPPPGHPERVSKLLINGKDYTKPRLAKRTIAITRGPGGKIEVEFTFWPVAYQRVIRKRSLKAEAGATVKLDLRKPDASDKLWVIYVPTPIKVVREMCKLADVKKGDVVYDIGCGDGRLVITAVKEFGAKKGVGIDLLADRVMQSKA